VRILLFAVPGAGTRSGDTGRMMATELIKAADTRKLTKSMA
jgi:hypothetical protein